MPTLTFHGAAGTVTGSKTLIESRGERALVDCGLFQGLKGLRELNWERPQFDARTLRHVILTHAHIDHCGWLPRLYKSGFRGTVYATPPTAELAGMMLLDSARLQEEDAAFLNKKGATRHSPALPLYEEGDVREVMKHFETVPYERWKKLSSSLSFRFINVGHLLGSAMAEVRIALGAQGAYPAAAPPAPRPGGLLHPGYLTILFSGDVGRYDAPLAPDPAPAVGCDVLVIESTYGNRPHAPEDLYEELAKTAERTFARGGVVLVPAFAVGRAQQVIYMLLELFRRGRIPKVPVHLDSPMAVEASRIYLRHADELDRLDGETIDAEYLQAMGVTAHRTRDDSKRLNDVGGPRVIVSSSGMLTGGRVLHHLARRLPDPRNTILFVGYQAAGTRGRALSEGAPYIRLHGMEVEARAEVVVMHGLSGHADAPELLRWTSALQPPRDVFVTHGEPDAAAALAEILRREKGWSARVPALHECFEI